MDSNTIIMLVLILFFGTLTIYSNKLKSRKIYYAKMLAIIMAILVLLLEGITNFNKRYYSFLLILIGMNFLYNQYKQIKNERFNSDNKIMNK